MGMTVGIMGGTFDPVHLGHIALAELALNEGGADKVLFIPAGDPPHKKSRENARRRLDMVRLALGDRGSMLASDMETARKGITYTIDTLSELRALYPREALYYIVGTDTLLVIEGWRMFPAVAEALDGLIVVPRPDTDERAARGHAAYLSQRYALDIRITESAGPDISSTAAREAIARAEPLDKLIPASVARYIGEYGLYLSPIREKLRRTLSGERYRHSIGVERESVTLARRFGADLLKTRVAALLHDCAKQLNPGEMRAVIEASGAKMSEAERQLAPQLLHAIAGVAVAKRDYGITDPGILSAIRWHTVGRAGMSTLEKIIYLADAIEPGRRNFAGIDLIREAAKTDLNEAVYLAAKRTYEYVIDRNMRPDHNTEALLNHYKPQGGQI